ncbi:MAG: MbnH family di-heme enzyme [Pseudomonadota bacterium]
MFFRPLLLLLLFAFALTPQVSAAESFDWRLPPWMPPPPVPANNPMSTSKVELGRRLFYDIRLSGPGYMSCASCHQQSLGFADKKRVPIGITGEPHHRNSMGLTNVAYFQALTWANSSERHLELQLRRPLFGTKPVEMGSLGHEQAIVDLLMSNSVYRKLFAESFPGTDGRIDFESIGKAIATFQRTLISARSPYDRYRYGGEPSAITSAAKRGEKLFFGQRLRCGQCHQAPHFTEAATSARFHNTGLYNLKGIGQLPGNDQGLSDITNRPEDVGRFRTPSLRNVAVTAPYMHDGSIATLAEVIEHYKEGGRAARTGAPSPLRSKFVTGFELTTSEKADLLAFLRSLTDREFLSDPRFSSPFK